MSLFGPFMSRRHDDESDDDDDDTELKTTPDIDIDLPRVGPPPSQDGIFKGRQLGAP